MSPVSSVRIILGAAIAIALSAGAAQAAGPALNAYRVKATADNLRALAAAGFDLTEGRDLDRGTIDVVGTAAQIGAAKVDARKLTNYTRGTVRNTSRSPRATQPPAPPTPRGTSGRSTTRSRPTARSSTPSSTPAC